MSGIFRWVTEVSGRERFLPVGEPNETRNPHSDNQLRDDTLRGEGVEGGMETNAGPNTAVTSLMDGIKDVCQPYAKHNVKAQPYQTRIIHPLFEGCRKKGPMPQTP